MNTLIKLFLVGSAFVAINQYFGFASSQSAKSQPNQTNGFVAVANPNGAQPGQVMVIGPTCNSKQGLKTKEITNQLIQARIPHVQSANFSISEVTDLAEVERLNQVMEGDAPIVFINGKAKANPTFQEVVAEYNRVTGKTVR